MPRRGRPRRGERRDAPGISDLEEHVVDFELDQIGAHDVQPGDPIRELQLGTSSGEYARRGRTFE